jgi:hypothetical protein
MLIDRLTKQRQPNSHGQQQDAPGYARVAFFGEPIEAISPRYDHQETYKSKPNVLAVVHTKQNPSKPKEKKQNGGGTKLEKIGIDLPVGQMRQLDPFGEIKDVGITHHHENEMVLLC